MAGPRPDVIAVRTDVMLDVLVRGLVDEAAQAADALEPVQVPAELAERSGTRVPGVAERVAREGSALRAVELRRFERAREPSAWLAERVAGLAAADLQVVCVRLARAEPAGLPRPDDPDAATWRISGPGGHVRHHAARMAVAAAAPRAGDGERAALRRCWLYGFFLAACGHQEAARRAATTPSGATAAAPAKPRR